MYVQSQRSSGAEYSSADNIESNIDSIAVDTAGAAEELTAAHEYQRKAGRRALCLMLVLVVVICIVLLAVRTSQIYLLQSAQHLSRRSCHNAHYPIGDCITSI